MYPFHHPSRHISGHHHTPPTPPYIHPHIHTSPKSPKSQTHMVVVVPYIPTRSTCLRYRVGRALGVPWVPFPPGREPGGRQSKKCTRPGPNQPPFPGGYSAQYGGLSIWQKGARRFCWFGFSASAFPFSSLLVRAFTLLCSAKIETQTGDSSTGAVGRHEVTCLSAKTERRGS